MLNGEGFTFQGLVRRLREEKFDPSLEQVREALGRLFHDWKIRWWGREIEMVHYVENEDPLHREDTGFRYVITAHESVDDAEYYAEGKNRVAKFYKYDSFPILGWANDADTAHYIAVHDWFGESLPWCAVHTVWERVPSKGMKRNGYKIAYHILGRAVMVPPVMPVREPEPPTEDMYIQAELEAVRQALEGSLDWELYKQLRDEGDPEIALSFSVKVNLKMKTAEAKMKGTVKLENSNSVVIHDPAQMELKLD